VTREHAVFEALGGAVLLGEASAEERTRFEKHAAGCGDCAEAARSQLPFERLRQERDAESWRPDVGDALLARMRERRTRTMRLTFGALAYAAGFSIVLNVVAATGFADRLYERIEAASRPNPAIPAAFRTAHVQPVAGPARVVSVHRYIQRPLTAPLPPRQPQPRSHQTGGRLGEVPDVLAGLVQPAEITAARDVAAEPVLHCDRELSDAEHAVACDALRETQPH